ncbi:enoyl-CoA hydratase/isomerase family protein [Mucilaginibacter phyllosphaerae]|uniref:Enoyl-CoA hydratase/isomerase family protein n=1 Tax=Mucilaginibacter phyllosphaerae TaxID=1812349 RepID=A0A4Y8AJ51_9SPHI|nr:enoyl-CoA hydratase/isomerase family protein [Mucilaginibacter phyllosphaerae]MBB3967890.1 methylglutaconyl-CoA hydratase [Mucilaginibacter phyllosphaerae]TEW69068.1 enoyl-CoA hydratase/isomerase family protein [Mucilaginibacter phyllosphaerae]GGH02640.1 enoyl-CoA hydratase [Mucilaginibacter phyllosphaerae]
MITDSTNGNVTCNTADGVATISFYHPAQNSLPAHLLQALTDNINQAGSNPQTKVIVLQSAGERTFCAGASFDELLQIKDKQAGAKFFSGFANVINACRKSTKIIIARVQGKAVGGGVGLAAGADYVLATQAASIKLSELAIGIGPFVISPAVIRKIGLPAFSQLTIRAVDFQTAQWAMDKGLYNEVYTDIKALDEGLLALTQKLASYHPQALTGLKQILWEGTGDWDELLTQRAAISGELVLSAFTQAALNGFLKKE